MDGYEDYGNYGDTDRSPYGSDQSIRLTSREDLRRQADARDDTAYAGSDMRRERSHDGGTHDPHARHRSSERGRTRPARRRRGIPVPAAVVAVVLCAGLAALVTFFVMRPQVADAQKQARDANNQVTQLTVENKQLQEQLTLAQQQADAAKTSASQSGSSSSANSSTAPQTGSASQMQPSGAGQGVESPWIKDGKFSTGDATLDNEVKEFCDGKVNTSMALEDAALEVYKGVAWADYVERAEAQHPSGADWRLRFARQFYENNCSGNCYEFAPFLAYCLRYLGYSDAIAEGCLIEQQSGNWGDHGIVFVTNTDGRKCLCDTARGTNGWMLDADSYNLTIQDFENA